MSAATANVLRGSYCPMVVPFRDGEIDYDGYAQLVERQIREGSHGILVNATSGEPTTLSLAERKKLVEVAKEASAGRAPIAAGTAVESHHDTVDLVRAYDEIGVDAIVVVTPYYIAPPQAGIVEYFVDVCRRTETPVLMYHIPGRAGVNVTLETFAAIRERCPNFLGVKNTDTDLALINGLVEQQGTEFRLFAGLEQPALATLAAGGAGVMITTANVVPGKLAALCESVEKGDLETARAINLELQPIFRAAVAYSGPIPVKYMLYRMGVLERPEHRLPMTALPDGIAKEIDALLKRMQLNA